MELLLFGFIKLGLLSLSLTKETIFVIILTMSTKSLKCGCSAELKGRSKLSKHC